VAALELDHNEAEREGRPADAPEVGGREEMLRERIDGNDTTGENR
jgi:cytochrome c oxidase subunit 1